MTGEQALTRREKLSYGSGELASNLAWNMATGFLLLYYSDVALLPVAALGTLMLVTRVLDAVFDPLAGAVVDRTRSAKGKARPWLLYAGVPFAILFVATFSVPEASTGAKLAYAYVTFALLGLCYSFLYVPYSAMLPMLTRRQDEKIELGGYRAMGSSLSSILAYGLSMPLVGLLGGGNRQLGFTLTAAVMAVLTIGFYLVVYRNCRERHALPASMTRPFMESVGKLFRNPVWRIAFGLGLLVFIKIGVMVSSLAFFTKDVMGRPGLVSIILPLMSVMIFVGGFFARRYVMRIGLVRANVFALIFQAALVALLIRLEGTPALFVAVFAVSNVASGVTAASNFRIGADAVEWHEQHFGHRDEGLMASGISFGLKVGIAIGTSITAFVLGWTGYDPTHATASANDALRWLTYASPIAINALMIACWSRFGIHRTPAVVSATA